jgi:hypothetical protein
LGFVVETKDDDAGILETRVSGRDKLFADDDSVCGRLSGFKETEAGI